MKALSKEIIDVIKYATRMEIEGRSFYEQAAQMTENEQGKKVFSKLAQDEIEHITTFGEIFTQSLGGDDWEKYVADQEERKAMVLQRLQERVEKHPERAGDQEALRIGMELERDSIDKYRAWRDETTESSIKKIFEKIIKEEEFHYDLLQAEYDSLKNSGFWLDMAEFKMDGKF